MRPVDQAILSAADRVSDPWLARGVTPIALTNVAPAWEPPDRLDEWPDFGVERLVAPLATDARRTRIQALPDRRPPPRDVSAADAGAAVARFLEMESEIRRHGDVRMIQGSSLELPHQWLLTNQLEKRRLELLYNLKIDPATGWYPSTPPISGSARVVLSPALQRLRREGGDRARPLTAPARVSQGPRGRDVAVSWPTRCGLRRPGDQSGVDAHVELPPALEPHLERHAAAQALARHRKLCRAAAI
jgi:hypothetical protein